MDRATAIVVALILAPVSLVMIVALIRGYDITVILRRRLGKHRDEE